VNREEYEVMINDVIADFTEVVFAAAERNRYKDAMDYPATRFIKGWKGFDLREKLLEEFKEVVEKPSTREIGDLGWVLAMMLDQIRSKPKETLT
jgi:hypothetical protein